MRISLRYEQRQLTIEVQREAGRYRISLDGADHVVEAERLGDATMALVIDGRRYRAAVIHEARDRLVAIAGEVYRFASDGTAAAHSVATVASPEITAPMPGKILQVLVQPGAHVEPGDGLLILEAMKMENRLLAEAAATVAEVRVAAGDMVDGGQVLIVLSYSPDAPGSA